MIAKISYIIDVEIEHEGESDLKTIISRTRQKIKRTIFDSPDTVKPTKITVKRGEI